MIHYSQLEKKDKNKKQQHVMGEVIIKNIGC